MLAYRLGALALFWFAAVAGAAPAPVADLQTVKRLLEEGRPAEAESAARALLHEAEEVSGPDSLGVADVLDQLAVALRRGGKASEAGSREICERAVRIRRASLGTGDPKYGQSLQNLGALLIAAGDFASAKGPLEEAVSVLDMGTGRESLELAGSLAWLATLRIRTEDPEGAEPLLRRAIAIRSKIQGPRDPVIGDYLDALGTLRYGLGDFTGAEGLYLSAIEILKATRPPGHPSLAAAYHNLGILQTEMGNFERALEFIGQALQARQKALGPEHPLVGTDYMDRGNIREHLGDLSGARLDYERSLEISTRALGADNPQTAESQVRLGRVYLQRADTTKAVALLQRALDTQEKTYGKESAWIAPTLSCLGRVAEGRGDLAAAAGFYGRAVEAREISLGPTHPDVSLSLGEYAAFLASAGKPDSALGMALRASEITRDHFMLTSRGLSEREALAFSTVMPHGLSTAVDIAAARPSGTTDAARTVWDSVIRSRTLILDEMATRKRISSVQESDTSLFAAAKSLEDARSRLSNLLVRSATSGSAARYKLAIESARAEVERLERGVASRSLVFREEQARNAIGWREVARALQPGDGIVGFVEYLGRDRVRQYAAFYMSRDREPGAIRVGTASEVDAVVSKWVRSLAATMTRGAGTSREDERVQGARLRKLIWDPISDRLGPVSRLYVVPDGSIYRVSFAGLPAEGAKYLIESGPLFHYLSSERDLASPATRSRTAGGLLALGGPSFDGEAASAKAGAASEARGAVRGGGDCPDLSTIRFTPLPLAAAEARDIAALWPGPDSALVLTGSAASEGEFKRRAPGRRGLHLATHGFFLGSDCAASAASARGIGGVSPSSAAGRHAVQRPVVPLLLSGLALAGANRRGSAAPGAEDGILTAEEVASLDLSGVDLAVLSACDTGLGKIHVGEGVLGLRRAFQVAGARSIVMSLWAVDDRATREWMVAFYGGRFKDRLGVADAVRRASLDVLQARRAQALSTSPFYWAAFVASGDWN